MGKLGKVLLGASVGVLAVAAAPFTGGGSILGGASFAAAMAGCGGIATTAGLVGAASGAIVNEVNKIETEKQIKTEKANSFKDGVKEGKALTVEEIKKFADFYLATTALSYYIARCDGEISEEEKAEIDVDLDAIYKNTDISDSIKKELYDIAHNDNITFEDVKKYLDNVSVETLKTLDNDIDEIINASGGISEEEKRAKELFEDYLEDRK